MSRDYGVVITESGAQVRFAEDYQKLLDTRWRPAGIVKAYPITMVPDTAAGLYKIFDHNLGYIPAMEAPRQTDYKTPSVQSSPIGICKFIADDTSVYLIKFDTSSFTNVGISGYIYLYDYPINQKFDSQYKGTSLARVAKSDLGIQIEGNNTWATARLGDGDNVGYAVNSNVKTIGLAKVDFVTFTPTSGATALTITYDIPYPPLIKTSNKVVTGDFISGSTPITVPKESWSALSMADNNVYFNSGSIGQSTVYASGLALNASHTLAYVIYRDPSEIAA